MKKNTLIIWLFCLLVLLICAWLLSIHKEGTPSRPPAVSSGNYQSNIVAQTEHNLDNGPNRIKSEPVVGQPQKHIFKSVEDAWAAAAKAQNVPVNFYGQVIDQDNNPLPNVKIVMDVRHGEFSPARGLYSTSPRKEFLTDLDGRFQWSDSEITGDILEVDSITKDGYESEPNVKRDYAVATGSVQNPVVFKMWQTNIHEQLISMDKSFHIVPDGRPYFINLTDGTIAESGGGDLKVWVKYPGQDSSGGTNNWFSEIDVINGGLLEETDAFSSMFSAPADGYTPAFQHNGWIRDNQHGSTGTRRFYIKLKNGQEYGRITIELLAPYNNQIPGLIRLSYAINPSGLCILR